MKNLILLKKYALNYLGKYDSTKKNLERILKNKIKNLRIDNSERSILYDSINSILFELESKKIINDKNYAQRKIQNYSAQGKSKKIIKKNLIFKGIENEIIKETFEKFELNNPDWELKSAEIFLRKKRIIHDKSFKNLQKNLSVMARAGFSYNTCKKLLKIND